MGFNTTVIVLNDALDQIASDPDFGKKLATAIVAASIGKEHLEKFGRLDDLVVSAGAYSNAATVIETHHADNTVVVAVGGNYGSVLGTVRAAKHHLKEDQWDILERVLDDSVQLPKMASERVA